MHPHVVIGYSVHWNQLELELVEMDCLVNVGVVEKGWVTVALRISRVLGRNLP
jgi:hypothetical protein